MKPMSESKMGMSRGEPESFFPDQPHKKAMSRPGEIKDFKYPDTEEAIHRDQESSVKNTSKNMPKPDFRH